MKKTKTEQRMRPKLKTMPKSEKGMNERRILSGLAAFLNTDIENVPKILERFKREISEMEEKLK